MAPLVVGREAQLLFYTLSLALAVVTLLVSRSSKNSWYATVARWEFGGLIVAVVVWTAGLTPGCVPAGHLRDVPAAEQLHHFAVEAGALASRL